MVLMRGSLLPSATSTQVVYVRLMSFPAFVTIQSGKRTYLSHYLQFATSKKDHSTRAIKKETAPWQTVGTASSSTLIIIVNTGGKKIG